MSSLCGNNIVCEIDNIQTTCEEDSGMNNILLKNCSLFSDIRKKSKTKDIYNIFIILK